jgi:protease-4
MKLLWRFSGLLFSMLFLSGCIFNLQLLPKVQPLQEEKIGGEGKAKILLIDLSGIINEEDRGGIVREPNMVSRIKEELKKAASDGEVKGVVLRVNSPGGTVTASDIIYHEVEDFKKKTGKKVVASIMDVGASGAYYVSMAADRIFAHPTAVTGSIGVIMLHLNLQGLLQKIGVDSNAIKSGPHKDMGSPLKPLSPEDRNLLQEIINGMYGRFLQVVQNGRPNLSQEKIRELADGRVYTADQALAAGLVDEIGYLDQAIDAAKKMADLAEAKVVVYKRPHEFKNTIYAQADAAASRPPWSLDPRVFLDLATPKFMYLWMP